MLVVDASVAVRWTIDTPLSKAAERLLTPQHVLIAPDLVIVEVTNALYVHVRGHPEKLERSLDGLEFIPRWFSELVPSISLRHRAMTYAIELGHAVYDCFYLALAASRDVQMITADDHFLRKVRNSSLSRHAVHLSEL